MKKIILLLILLFFTGGFSILPAVGQESAVLLKSKDVRNQFPDGVAFEVVAEITAPDKIKEIKLEMGVVGGSARSAYAYLDFAPDTTVQGKYLLRTGGAQYKPVGTLIEYRFVITDSKGRVQETQKDTFMYMDNRFEWDKVSDGPVEVYYYGSTRSRAELILKASVSTVAKMSALLGLKSAQFIRVIGYNDYSQMVTALPPQAKAAQKELITQGQAWYDYGIFLMLAGDPRADGVASHELTHMVVAEATKNALVTVPAWLNEGLAEYANVNPGYSYDTFLAQAISAGKLFPLRHMQAPPGIPAETILFYGQSRAIVKYLIDTYGEDKFRQLFSAFNKDGLQIDEALKKAYGFDQDGLDNAWRKSLGLPPVEAAPTVTVAPPSPKPAPTPKEPEKPATPAQPRGGFGCAAPVPAFR
ncbi:MAG: hypothetical protein HYX79_07080 [Chloroflexi bacterium]|nr:hypothetical protein [Chloroflexota bacterium]